MTLIMQNIKGSENLWVKVITAKCLNKDNFLNTRKVNNLSTFGCTYLIIPTLPNKESAGT